MINIKRIQLTEIDPESSIMSDVLGFVKMWKSEKSIETHGYWGISQLHHFIRMKMHNINKEYVTGQCRFSIT